MALDIVKLTLGAWAGGVVTTYFFHLPTLNEEGIKKLVLSSIPGTIFTVASLCISSVVAERVKNNIGKTKREKNRNEAYALLAAYSLSTVLVAVTAKTVTNRLGTPREALTNFAVSTVLGVLGILIQAK